LESFVSQRYSKALQFALLLSLVAWTGCSPPAVAPDNQRLTVSLRTALSTKRFDWLELNAKEVEARRAEGKMNDDEYAAFTAIIAQARAGEWESAEKEVVRLQKAQRPTPEQIERLTASRDHEH
jgi:hypothetical protein